MTRTHPTALVAAAALLAWAPAAAANDATCDERCRQEVDFFLLQDPKDALALSRLAPSAANRTTWTFHMATEDGKAEKRVLVDFPRPDAELDESVGLEGAVKARAARVASADGPQWATIESARAKLEVRLVEGQREALLGKQTLGARTSTLELSGDYPGHGADGGPHTHGAGDDAERGLFLSDLRVALVFTLERNTVGGAAVGHEAEYEFGVEIDGRSFLTLAAVAAGCAPQAAPAPAPGGAGPSPTPSPNATDEPNATEEPNETAPSAPTPSNGSRAPGSGLSASANAALSLSAMLATVVGIGLFTLTRGRRGG